MSKRIKPSPIKSEPVEVVRKDTPFIEKLSNFADWMVYEIPPGPPCVPMRFYVNIHKGSMFFYILGLMWYFDNFTHGAYLYLCLHGSYGFFWLLKDIVFPDPGFARLTTVSS